MRILHTSDWHLNDQLGRQPRQADIVARLEEIAAYLKEYQVDVMVVAGDLFSERHQKLEDWKQALEDVNRVFKPFLLSGGTIVAISGNHDNEAFFNLLRFSLDLASPIDAKQSLPRPSGRLYLAAQPTSLLLQDKSEQQVQFLLMPYPTVQRYLRNEAAHYNSLEEKNHSLHQAMLNKISKMQSCLNPRLRSVLVAHAHIRGSQIHNLYRISEREDVIFDSTDLSTHWEYGAFGHIHKPQSLLNTNHIRYSGSIERLDAGEKEDDKGVVLVEIGANGRSEDPVTLPLNATPIYQIEIRDPEADIARLRDRTLYPEPERALVKYHLIYKPGEHNREAICQEIERLFPRCCDRKIETIGAISTSTSAIDLTNRQDASSATLQYLQNHLADHPDRDAILSLYETLLVQEVPS
jgi:DNA repair protein SbcD/Mre11